MESLAESLVEQVITQCTEGRFTGLLRVRAREGDGEIRFLSGIREDARFGVSTGDEALERLLRATSPKFEAVPRLPGLTGGFKQRLAAEGTFGELRPIDLLRYCESYALTCTLELVCKGKRAQATYHIGELVSIDTDGDAEADVAVMLDSNEGSYRFVLPPFELPEGLTAHITMPPPPASEPQPGSVQQSANGLAARTEDPALRKVEEAVRRKAAETVDAKRRAAPTLDESRQPEAEIVKKLEAEAESRRVSEARRKTEQAQAAEAKRKAEDEARAAEAKRKAEEEARAAEAKRKAEEEAQAAEAKRTEEARRSKPKKTKESEAPASGSTRSRKADSKAPRSAGGKKGSSAKERAGAKRDEEADLASSAAGEAPQRSMWLWLVLGLIAILVILYFLKAR
jgi:hypothetical protein